MKRLLGFLVVLLLFGAKFATAATICPTTSNTNSDCGYILTIGAGNTVTGAVVAGADPYDGGDDVLVGVINNSGAVFTGAITLSGSGNGGGLFGFDGDGICTYIGGSAAGSYCSASDSAGLDPGDYQGPINTFSNISPDTTTGDVDIAGLADGASTFFSLEGAPNTLVVTPPVITGTTPEPGSLVLLSTGMLGVAGVVRRKFAA